MASSVATTFNNAADGESFSAVAHRLGFVSHATVVGGSTGLKSRSGIIPSGAYNGDQPLDVVPLGTPAMKVTVRAGTCAVQSTSATGGCYSMSLLADTDLDIATANATNPRLGLVVATVFDDGTSASNTKIEVLTGTPAASPVRPSISSPPANTHYFPLAQVRVEANATSIVSGKVTKVAGTDGVFTVPPGSLVPVANLTEAATLPLYTPFYSTTDRAHGTVLPGGASLDGHQTRIMRPAGNTNGSGDVDFTHGVYLNGTWTAAPFANTCDGALVGDSLQWSLWNAPVWFKQHGSDGPPSTTVARFRVYTVSGGTIGPMVSAAINGWGF